MSVQVKAEMLGQSSSGGLLRIVQTDAYVEVMIVHRAGAEEKVEYVRVNHEEFVRFAAAVIAAGPGS